MAETIWKEYSEAYAFLGNSLLKPMSQTPAVGLEPEFWDAFPRFGSDEVEAAVSACAKHARSVQAEAENGVDVVKECSVEFTHLFVGPPTPAAAPWETMHRGENATVGFGESTFEMKRLLRSVGLEIHNENNQYEDHMGIELLLLAVLCERIGQDVSAEDVAAYIESHPFAWIGRLQEQVAEACPDGYFAGLIEVGRCVMKAQLEDLAGR